MGDLQRTNGATTQREDFSGAEIQHSPETASSAVAAQAKAAVEARYILAMKRPRDLMDVRVRMLKECDRPGFASVARYAKPIGKDKSKWPTGPSIRFVEAAIRCMTNIYPESSIIYDDDSKRIVQVAVTDLEANVTYNTQIVIAKTMERKQAEPSQVISKRKNSYGEWTYTVPATEDDILNKQNAAISKALRTNGLRIIPGDIVDECMSKVIDILQGDIKADPDAAKKKIVDAFSGLSIMPSDLAMYLGHSLDRLGVAEIAELRQIYAALKDGETTWEAVLEAREPGGTTEAAADVGTKKLATMQEKAQPAVEAAGQSDAGEDADIPFETSEQSTTAKPKFGFKAGK